MSGSKIKIVVDIPLQLFNVLKVEFRRGTGIVLRPVQVCIRKSTNPKIRIVTIKGEEKKTVHLLIMLHNANRRIEISSPDTDWVLPILTANIPKHWRIML